MAEDRGPEAELSETSGPVIAHTTGGAVYDRPPFESKRRLLAPSELSGRDVVLVRWVKGVQDGNSGAAGKART